MNWILGLGALGSIVTVLTAIFVLVRVMIRNVDATTANTTAINKLHEDLPKLGDRVSNLEKWQAIMEDRQKRR